MSKFLVKTDKNGTEYWADDSCPKCGGTGYIHCYDYVEGGICFKCDGTGVGSQSWKVYTPEYQAKLDAKRAVKAEKDRLVKVAASAEKNKEFFEKQGFNSEGKTYSVLGNTYAIKDELKAAGARWSNLIGWHFPVKPDKYPTVEIAVDDVYAKDCAETYTWQSSEKETYSAKIKAANDALSAQGSLSQHVGTVGDKLEVSITLTNRFEYETHITYYGETHYVYIMTDAAGNVFKWDTSKFLEKTVDGGLVSYQAGASFTIKGTVKELSEYKGVKQTVLTRCKIKDPQ